MDDKVQEGDFSGDEMTLESEKAAYESFLWANVKTALSTAKGMYFDGCHKIYLAVDNTANNMFISEDWPEANIPDLDLIQTWFGESCALRFISAVTGDDSFERVIRQGDLS